MISGAHGIVYSKDAEADRAGLAFAKFQRLEQHAHYGKFYVQQFKFDNRELYCTDHGERPGTNQTVTGTATDKATSPDAAGWSNSAVTVNFQCSDNLSGIAQCPRSQTVSTAGAGQTISGTASDIAGSTSAELAARPRPLI